MKYKRLIILFAILIVIIFFGFIQPQFNSNFDKFKVIKHINYFFPALGFTVWLLFSLTLEMCFRLNYKIKDAILTSISSFKIIKEYKQYLNNNKRKFDWLYISYFVDIGLIFILIFLLIILNL